MRFGVLGTLSLIIIIEKRLNVPEDHTYWLEDHTYWLEDHTYWLTGINADDEEQGLFRIGNSVKAKQIGRKNLKWN